MQWNCSMTSIAFTAMVQTRNLNTAETLLSVDSLTLPWLWLLSPPRSSHSLQRAALPHCRRHPEPAPLLVSAVSYSVVFYKGLLLRLLLPFHTPMWWTRFLFRLRHRGALRFRCFLLQVSFGDSSLWVSGSQYWVFPAASDDRDRWQLKVLSYLRTVLCNSPQFSYFPQILFPTDDGLMILVHTQIWWMRKAMRENSSPVTEYSLLIIQHEL